MVCALLGRHTPLFVLHGVALALLQECQGCRKSGAARSSPCSRGESEITDERLSTLLTTTPTPLPSDIGRMVRGCVGCAFLTQTNIPLIPLLVVDDAAPFNHLLTEEVALCWVTHAWRHYTKVGPLMAFQRWRLDRFAAAFWTLYRRLLAYPMDASSPAAFDALFPRRRAMLSWTTGRVSRGLKQSISCRCSATPRSPYTTTERSWVPAGGQARCEPRGAHFGRRGRGGYFPDAGGHGQETGREHHGLPA